MEFFLNEILEDEEVKSLLRSDPEQSTKGKAVAEEIVRTGGIPDLEKGVFPLFVLAHMADFTLQKNNQRGIPHEITVATLKDTNIWIQNYRTRYGGIGLAEFGWLMLHFSGGLFRLGRLQFRPLKSRATTPSGEYELEVHIPQGEPLAEEACLDSFARAKEFFAAYFPEKSFEYFVCHSWLLSPHLAEFLPGTSNTVKFMRLWTIHTVDDHLSNTVVARVFRLGMKREELTEDTPAVTSMQRNLKAYLLSGGEFRDAAGYRKI